MNRQPEEEQTGKAETDVSGEKDVEALKQALARERERAESCLASWQRTQADFINYRRRSEQEKEEFRQSANSALILSLLPVLDDLELAFNSMSQKQEEAGLSWVDGIRLIKRKLRASMEAHGLSPIEAVGKPFDPHQHEAVRQDKGKEGVVLREVQKGYKLHDRVLRPARVVVGNGDELEEESQIENNGRE